MIPDGDKTGENFVQFTPATMDGQFFFNPTGIAVSSIEKINVR